MRSGAGGNNEVKVLIFPYDSLILYDLVARFGHQPLGIVEAKENLKPEDSPPYGITLEHPTLGLKYCPVEVPSGVRGRLALLGPLLEEADACIFMENIYGFCESGCDRANLYMKYLAHEKGLPVLKLKMPQDEEEAQSFIEQLKFFLDDLETRKQKEETSSR